MYEAKKLDVTLGIVSLNAYFYEIQKTVNSANFLTWDCEKIAVIPFETNLEKPVSCQVTNGGYCITTMIDSLVKNAKTEWIHIVFAGTYLKKSIDEKYSRYISGYKDILFPVVDRIWNFVDGSINGLMLSKKLHEEVGDFGSGDNLQLTKLIWAHKAIEKGCKFKAIVGGASL